MFAAATTGVVRDGGLRMNRPKRCNGGISRMTDQQGDHKRRVDRPIHLHLIRHGRFTLADFMTAARYAEAMKGCPLLCSRIRAKQAPLPERRERPLKQSSWDWLCSPQGNHNEPNSSSRRISRDVPYQPWHCPYLLSAQWRSHQRAIGRPDLALAVPFPYHRLTVSLSFPLRPCIKSGAACFPSSPSEPVSRDLLSPSASISLLP